MTAKRYERVSLRRDLPEYNLLNGDVATVVDFAAIPDTGEEGCVLEAYSAVGELLATVTVPYSDIQPLQQNEIFCVRRVTKLAA
jgi:hypothetical protein